MTAGRVIELVVWFLMVYFGILASVYTVMAAVGWRTVGSYVRRRPLRDYRGVGESPLSMPVSILAPAYNEAPTIVGSIRGLLRSQFVNFEIIVINDGSTDDTLEQLVAAFSLVPATRAPRAGLATAPVQRVWVSATEPRLTVLDKANGGKADALNAGLCYARYPLVCAIDADTILDPGALPRLVWEFQSHPDTVATGGIVRIVNGSRVEAGRVVEVRTSTSLIANIQILEYLRAFLAARVGWSRLQMVLIISGAFGLFRRQAVIDAGGYDTTTVGEDAELVLRLHRHHREQGRPCRITFFPDPICWTEAPSDLRSLVRQRDRWQRGLIEMLGRHRSMIANPRYGRLGMLAVPYYVFFEMLGPIVETVGLVAVVTALVFGLASPTVLLVTIGLSITYSFVLSYTAILLEERLYRRAPEWRCLVRLMVAALAENIGYRQLMTVVRARAWWTIRRASTWGEMRRIGFEVPVRSGDVAA